jgi:hypothetical protein
MIVRHKNRTGEKCHAASRIDRAKALTVFWEQAQTWTFVLVS